MKFTGVLTDRIIFIVLFILTISLKTPAQTSHPKREMRAIWVATVDNIDWPSRPGLPVNLARDGNQPSSPLDVKIIRNKGKFLMKWNHPENNADGTYFVVYRFKGEESGSIDNPENIYHITAKPEITIRKRCLLFRTNFTFVVTTVSRLHYESQPSEKITLKY